MKRLRGILRLLLILILIVPHNAHAANTASGVMITEVQTASLQSADHEFIELYNQSDNIIALDGWKLQYLSATGTTWLTKATLSSYLMPRSTLLIASNGYLSEISDFSFSAGFKVEAGHVRLISTDQNNDETVVHDVVGWGATAKSSETLPAAYSPAGQSMARSTDSDNEYIDTDNNQVDFKVSSIPSPVSTNLVPTNISDLLPKPEQESEEDSQEPSLTPEESLEPKQYVDQSHLSPAVITEILPNPAPPETDADDEYIELYNPNSQPFHLDGYQLQTGNNYRYDYTFETETIPAHQYLVLYSSKTGLALSNTSGRARLVDPYGVTVSETDPYEKAKDGEAWSLINNKWQWNTKPTAGEPNILIAPTSSTKKKKAVKAKKTKKKKQAAQAISSLQSGDDAPNSVAKMNTWVIAGIGLVALGYAVYEYKDDIRNKLRQLRRNRTLGQGARGST